MDLSLKIYSPMVEGLEDTNAPASLQNSAIVQRLFSGDQAAAGTGPQFTELGN